MYKNETQSLAENISTNLNLLNIQTGLSNGIKIAQSFQMKKMNRSLINVADAMLQNSQILNSILDIQKEIKGILASQLEEGVKANKLKAYEIEQNTLRYDQQQAEKQYIRTQRNLAFELKNSVKEVDESNSTRLEKYIFLKISLEIFEGLDTEKFQISEMEYSREAFNSMIITKNKYESLLTEKDNHDLNIIKNIELEDENKDLINLKRDLKKFARFKNQIQELKNINLKKLPKTIRSELNNLIKKIEKNNES
tara:strand:+ start:118 stop:876 length:759 start_codon:yes stop_codon:yes gene_type:complete